MKSLDELMSRYFGADAETKRRVLEAADKVLSGGPPEPPPPEKLLNLTELAEALGYRSPITPWRLGVHAVAENWCGGRRLYRLSRVVEYLRSPEARKKREALREAKRSKSKPGRAGGGEE